MRNVLILLLTLTLLGCATTQAINGSYEPPILVEKSIAKEFDTLPSQR